MSPQAPAPRFQTARKRFFFPRLSAGAKRLGFLYRPALLAQAQVRYLKRTYKLDHEEARAALVEEASNGGLRWEDHGIAAQDERKLERHPAPDAAFAPLEGALADSKGWKSLENAFVDWLYRSAEIRVWHNEKLKLYGGPELSEDDFLKLCEEAAEGQREAEIEKTKKKYERQLKSLEKKLSRERRELEEDKAEASQRKMEEMGTHLDNVIGLFSGRSRRLTTSLTKRRLSSQAQADVEESLHTIQDLEGDIQELGEEIQEVVEEIHARWDEQAAKITQIPVTPLKKDIFVSLFGVAWLPYHRVEEGGREMELAAFEIES